MSDLLKIVLSLSVSGTLLFFLMMALKPLYKNKLSKKWQYYIWLIVIVRMLLPFTLETTLVGSAFQYLENTRVGTSQSVPSTNEVQSDFGLSDNYTMPNTEPQVPKSTIDTEPSLSIQTILSKVFEHLWILWAVIAFALLIRKITMYQSFVRFVKAGQTEVADIELLNMLADVGETIGVKRPVELFINPLISSPMLLGFFRPYIILPNIKLERTELAYIMRHELTHYKHMDMFYKWLVQITVCLHWFNPFAYLLAKEINKCCELSCDEAIIRTMDKDEKKAYGDTLLNSLQGIGNYNDKLATVTLTEGAEQLKERLDAIISFRKKTKRIAIIAVTIAILLATSATLLGAYAGVKSSLSNSTTANILLPISNTVFSTSDYKQIIALKFEHYQKMTISEYRNNILERTNTQAFMNLFEAMTSDNQLFDMQDTNATASFLFHTLRPFISENWETNQFHFSMKAPEKLATDFVNVPAELEVTFTYSILKPNVLTIGEYEEIRDNIKAELQQFFLKKSEKELQDNEKMNTAIQSLLEELCNKWSNESFAISDSNFYFIELLSDIPLNGTGSDTSTLGTETEYRSLLQLKTESYKNQTVANFNSALLNWANENSEGYGHIIEHDVRQNRFPDFLTDDEKDFLSVTVRASNSENSMSVQSYYSDTAALNPGWSFEFIKGSQENSYALLMYGFSYELNAASLTVGERDLVLSDIINEVRNFWDNVSLKELSTMGNADVYGQLEKIVVKYSTPKVKVSLDKDLYVFDTSSIETDMQKSSVNFND